MVAYHAHDLIDLNVGIGFECFHILEGQLIQKIDIAGLQFDHARRRFGDGAEDHFVQQRVTLHPVVRILFEGDILAGDPFDKGKGAGTDGCLRNVYRRVVGDNAQ